MGKTLLGVDVTEDGSNKIAWATVGAVIVGSPLYLWGVQFVELIQLTWGGVKTAIDGFFGWLGASISIPLEGTATAIRSAWFSFQYEVLRVGRPSLSAPTEPVISSRLEELGILAFPVTAIAVSVASFAALVLLWAVIRR